VIFSQPGIEGYMLGGFMFANQEQWHHAHGVVKALREEVPSGRDFRASFSSAATRKRNP